MGYSSSLTASGIIAPQLLFNAPPAAGNAPAAASTAGTTASPAAATAQPAVVSEMETSNDTSAAASLAQELSAGVVGNPESLTSPFTSDASLTQAENDVTSSVLPDEKSTATQRQTMITDFMHYLGMLKSRVPDGYQGTTDDLNLDRGSIDAAMAIQSERSAEPDL